MKRFMFLMMAILSFDSTLKDVDRELCEEALKFTFVHYLDTVTYDDEPTDSTPDRKRTISSFTPCECKIFFQFRRDDLVFLCRELRFPDIVKLNNGIKMPGEEVMLRGLYELVSGENQHKIALHIFGRDGSVQSRAFLFFIEHIMDNFSHLMTDNLSWWFRNGFIRESAEAIKRKVDLATDNDEEVAMFIDCNCLETARCGGGPAEQGANAARWNPDIQRSMYNGWKSITGLKHQTIDIAHGFCIDLYGPTSVRRNDLTLYRLSDINGRVAAANGAAAKYIVFGDSAYKRFSHTRTYYPTGDGIDNHRRWNSKMKSVRISIEWNYANTAALFKYVCNKRKLQLLQSDCVTKVYKVATFLRNLHIGMYGCQSSNYFNLPIRENFVEHYLRQTDF